MGSRFSRVKQGAYLKSSLDNYIEYLQEAATRQPQVNSRGARPDQRYAYVVPFDKDIGTGKSIMISVAVDSYNKLSPKINASGTGGEIIASASSGDVVSGSGFSPARVVYFENANRTVTTPNSKFTGKEYLKYTGTRYSCPFGRKTATDDLFDAFAAIKSEILTGNSNEVKRVSLTAEKWRSR
jgi:hypothetical protein